MTRYSGADNLEVMHEAKNYNRFLVDLVLAQARAGDCIVDFGAGAGTFALPVSAAGYRVLCIEPDRELAAGLARRGLTVQHDLAAVADASIDYLYSLNVLEHIADDAAVVALWHRKLAAGGRLLIYVPAFELLFSSMDRKVGHHRRYRLGALRKLLRAAGFDIGTGRYVDSLGAVAALVYKLVDNGSGEIDVGMLKAFDRIVFPASRALDRVVGGVAGKNLYLVCTKPA